MQEIAKAKGCKAVAIVFDVRVTLPNSNEKCDAIQISVEHIDGYSVEIFFPYQIADGTVVYSDTFAQQGKHEIFQ